MWTEMNKMRSSLELFRGQTTERNQDSKRKTIKEPYKIAQYMEKMKNL